MSQYATILFDPLSSPQISLRLEGLDDGGVRDIDLLVTRSGQKPLQSDSRTGTQQVRPIRLIESVNVLASNYMDFLVLSKTIRIELQHLQLLKWIDTAGSKVHKVRFHGSLPAGKRSWWIAKLSGTTFK